VRRFVWGVAPKRPARQVRDLETGGTSQAPPFAGPSDARLRQSQLPHGPQELGLRGSSAVAFAFTDGAAWKRTHTRLTPPAGVRNTFRKTVGVVGALAQHGQNLKSRGSERRIYRLINDLEPWLSQRRA
jgi:hypothetical protein